MSVAVIVGLEYCEEDWVGWREWVRRRLRGVEKRVKGGWKEDRREMEVEQVDGDWRRVREDGREKVKVSIVGR